LANSTEKSTLAWTIVAPSFCRQAYQNDIYVFSPGPTLSSSHNSSAVVSFFGYFNNVSAENGGTVTLKADFDVLGTAAHPPTRRSLSCNGIPEAGQLLPMNETRSLQESYLSDPKIQMRSRASFDLHETLQFRLDNHSSSPQRFLFQRGKT